MAAQRISRLLLISLLLIPACAEAYELDTGNLPMNSSERALWENTHPRDVSRIATQGVDIPFPRYAPPAVTCKDNRASCGLIDAEQAYRYCLENAPTRLEQVVQAWGKTNTAQHRDCVAQVAKCASAYNHYLALEVCLISGKTPCPLTDAEWTEAITKNCDESRKRLEASPTPRPTSNPAPFGHE